MISRQEILSERNRGVLIRYALVAGVLLLSALLPWVMPEGRMALLMLALIPAALLSVLILRRLPIGVALVVLGGMLIPFGVGTGTGSELNPAILLVPLVTGLWFLDMALRRRDIRLSRHPSVFLLLAFTGVALLSFIVGQLPWFAIPGAGLAAQVGGLMTFFLSAAAFMVSAHVLNRLWVERLVYLFLGIGALYVVGRLLPPLGTLFLPLFNNGATGSVFWTWLVALAAGLALFHDRLPRGARLALGALAMATLFVGLTRSRDWAAGWAPALVALLVLIWLRFPRSGWVPLAGAAVVFVLQLDRFWGLATTGDSWLARQQAWRIVLDAARSNPLLGLGPSNYYFYVQQAKILGWGGAWNVKFSSHNNWVDLIAQVGLIGLALFLGFALAIGQVAFRLYQRLPDGFTRAYAAACLAGLVATLAGGMLGDWFIPFVYNVGLAGMRSSLLFWIFLGGLLALHHRS